MRLNRLSLVLLFVFVFTLTGCGTSVPTLGEPVFAQSVDQKTGKAINPQTAFDSSAKMIYVSILLKDAPAGTKIRFEWYYLEQGEVLIDKVDIMAEGGRYVFAYLKSPENGFLSGKYKVAVFLNDEKLDESGFSVKGKSSVENAGSMQSGNMSLQPKIFSDKLTGLAMAEDIDASGSPVGRNSVFNASGREIYCFAFVKNIKHGTIVKYDLYYLGQSNTEPALSVIWKSDRVGSGYVHALFTNDNNWPTGDYKAIVSVDGSRAGELGFKMQ